MDRLMEIRHLEEARGHVALGERHIAEQRERIAYLARPGHDTSAAEKLLDSFYVSQENHVHHLNYILKRLRGSPDENMVPQSAQC